MACVSVGTWLCSRTQSPTASLNLFTTRKFSSVVSPRAAASLPHRSGLLHCSFVPTASLSLSSATPFSGSSLGFNWKSTFGVRREKYRGLVVRAGKYRLCQTKRNRSRKSLARTHGFRKRMSTTRGRAVLKRRRAKGRWILCTKTNPISGPRS